MRKYKRHIKAEGKQVVVQHEKRENKVVELPPLDLRNFPPIYVKYEGNNIFVSPEPLDGFKLHPAQRNTEGKVYYNVDNKQWVNYMFPRHSRGDVYRLEYMNGTTKFVKEVIK